MHISNTELYVFVYFIFTFSFCHRNSKQKLPNIGLATTLKHFFSQVFFSSFLSFAVSCSDRQHLILSFVMG